MSGENKYKKIFILVILNAHEQNENEPQCSVESGSFASCGYIAQGGSKPRHGRLRLANSCSTAENLSYDEMGKH